MRRPVFILSWRWIATGVCALTLASLALGASRLARSYGAQGKAAAGPVGGGPPLYGIGFEEVAQKRGVRFRWQEKRKPLRNTDSFGVGGAFVDFDNNGHQDILLVGEPVCGLFLNNGRGEFTDATHKVGLHRFRGMWTGCAIGDYDGDGWLDFLITGYHRLALLRSEKAQRLSDVTHAANLDPTNGGNWGSSAGFMDLDGDADHDLVVLNYVVSGPGIEEYCRLGRGVLAGCPPSVYEAEYGRLFRNEGNGTFRDASAAAGFKTTHGKALVVAFCDVNEDGRMDFYIGNDGTPADFMENTGRLTFRNVSLENGTAYGDMPGHPLAAMGADWADFDRDGDMDLAVSAFSDEVYAVYRNEQRGLFSHVSAQVGLARVTLKPLGFGTKFADVDNDAWPDLIFANGHVYDRVQEIDPGSGFRQPLMIFRSEQGSKFTDLVPALGGKLARPLLGRGLATGDFDNDGRIDLLVVDYERAPLLLRNTSETPNHWVTLQLVGAGPHRFGYGTRVVARAGAEAWVGQVSPAGSYLSSSDPRVHFGLGTTTRLDSLTISWPSGAREVVLNPPIDRIVIVREVERIGITKSATDGVGEATGPP